MPPDLFGIVVTLAAFAVLLGLLVAYHRSGHAHPELLRKLLHVGMGAVILSFPWLFRHAWPVLLLAGLFAAIFLSRKLFAGRSGRPASGLSGVLDGVGRTSYGELYYAVSVAALFLLARGQPMLFFVPMLLLTLPDAVAALVGMRYGRHRYATTVGEKSAEGSVAYFAVALLAVHVPLLLFDRPPVGRAESLLIAVTLALLSTILEAIAWRGLDNLFVPLGAFVLLKAFRTMSAADLTACCLVAAAAMGFSLIWRARTTLDGGAALSSALLLYVAWALGGWKWLVAPLATFIGYAVLWPRTDRERQRGGHNIQAVASVAAAGLVWVILKQSRFPGDYFYPYTLGFAVHVAIIGATRLRRVQPRAAAGLLMAKASLQAWALLFVPYLAVESASRRSAWLAAAALPVIAIAVAVFYATQPGIRDCPVDRGRWMRQGAYAVAASAIGLLSLRLL
jgi:phytol kinase